jgi:hypothetical protein
VNSGNTRPNTRQSRHTRQTRHTRRAAAAIATARTLAACTALCACAQAARAEFVVYTIKQDWLNAVPSAITSIGAPNIPNSSGLGPWLVSHGLSMSGASSRPLWPDEAPYWNLPAGTNIMNGYNCSFNFAAHITSFAMEVEASGSSNFLSYAVYGQNGYVGSFEIPTTNIPGPRFFGIISTQPFRQIFGNSGSGSAMVSTLMFTQVVPAPGALAVFAGLFVHGARRRR